MTKTPKTIAQTLKIKDFPFEIKDKNGNEIYCESSTGCWDKYEYDSNGKVIYSEDSNGYWCKREYDSNGNEIYFENSDEFWIKREYDSNGKLIYYENSDEFWYKREYDSNGKLIYYENSDGYIKDNRPKKIIELTIEDIAKLKGVDASLIRIKEYVEKFLEGLETTWSYTPEELADIRRCMAEYAMAATFDSVVREEVYKICNEE